MKVLILTTIKAPYRVNLFNEIGKKLTLSVCFEQEKDNTRENKWYSNSITSYEAIELQNWNKPQKIKWEFFEKIREFKPDQIIFYEYSTKTAVLAILYCQLKGIPYFINNDGAFIDENISRLKKRLKKILVRGAKGLLANGKSATNYFIYYGARISKINQHHFSSLYTSEILKQPIPYSDKLVLRKEKNIIGFKKIAITVGRFEEIKGIDILLNAWKFVNDEYLLIVVGSGKLQKEYHKIVENKNNILFVDYLDKPDLLEYYKLSDINIIPTRGDVWGLVVNESMAMGLPVISSNKCNAGLELIKDGVNGYIVSNDNIQNYVSVINDIFNKSNQEIFEMGVVSLENISPYAYELEAEEHIKFLRRNHD